VSTVFLQAVSVIEGQHVKNRVTLVIVDEAAGF
jgi:hypothetical protein